MTRPTITLVHSSDYSTDAVSGREEWGFENARQLTLFDEFEKTRFLIIATGELGAQSFAKILIKYRPDAIIDTRPFPDFFRIFESTSAALASLKNQGIEYLRAPINLREPGKALWEQLSKFQLQVDRRNAERKTNAPIVVLVSTTRNKTELRSRIEGYLENNIPNALFLEA